MPTQLLTDLLQQNAHADAEFMFANPGLGTEAHKIWYISDHSCHIGLNVRTWLQISSLTKNFVPQFIYCISFTSKKPHLCLRALVSVVHKVPYIYLLIPPQSLWFSFTDAHAVLF